MTETTLNNAQRETTPTDVRIGPSGPLGGYVDVPPSKNYTTRMILAAFLAEGRSVIERPAVNDDSRALVRCCRAMGGKLEEQGDCIVIAGVSGRPKNPGVLNPGNAGAVLRLLLGAACLIDGEVRFETDFPESLGRRPNEDLLAALRMLGAQAKGTGPEGLLPITIEGRRDRARGIKGGKVSVSGARSSQFLSSLLFLAPHLGGDSEIEVTGGESEGDLPVLVSRPLIDQTLDVLARFGARVKSDEGGFRFHVDGNGTFEAGEHTVPGDWPSAAALLCAVAVTGGMASLVGLREDPQGERRIRDALEGMGCRFTSEHSGQLYIHSQGNLRSVEFDGDLATDAVLALEAAACLAEGTTRIINVGNLRLKETDRIKVPLEELAKVGVESRHGKDWIEIDGRPEGYEGGVDVDCRGDHRIAQLLAIVATRCEKGLVLRGAHCVSKSYPGFFDDLKRLGVKLSKVGG